MSGCVSDDTKVGMFIKSATWCYSFQSLFILSFLHLLFRNLKTHLCRLIQTLIFI